MTTIANYIDGEGREVVVYGEPIIGTSPKPMFIVIPHAELPVIETVNGRPKGPAQEQHNPATTPAERAERLRREAIEKFALARAWDGLVAKQERDILALTSHLTNALGGAAGGVARHLVEEMGWKR